MFPVIVVGAIGSLVLVAVLLGKAISRRDQLPRPEVSSYLGQLRIAVHPLDRPVAIHVGDHLRFTPSAESQVRRLPAGVHATVFVGGRPGVPYYVQLLAPDGSTSPVTVACITPVTDNDVSLSSPDVKS